MEDGKSKPHLKGGDYTKDSKVDIHGVRTKEKVGEWEVEENIGNGKTPPGTEETNPKGPESTQGGFLQKNEKQA